MSEKIFGFDKNFNKKNSAEIIVSSTEPTGDNREKVWIQKGKNLFDFKNMINSSLNESNGTLQRDVTRLVTPFIFLMAGTYTVSCNLSRFAYVIYNKDKTFKSFVTWNTFPNQIVLENDCYIKLEVIKDYNGSENVSITDISYLQLEQSSIATTYEEYIEPKIYVKNDNGVYEEYVNVARIPKEVESADLSYNSTKFQKEVMYYSKYGNVVQIAIKAKVLVDVAVSDTDTIKVPYIPSLGTSNVFFAQIGTQWPEGNDMSSRWGYIDMEGNIRTKLTAGEWIHLNTTYVCKD